MASIHRENMDHPVLQVDVSDERALRAALRPFFPIHFVQLSPPCQQFSRMYSGEEGACAELTVQAARALVWLRPRAFLLENVPGMVERERPGGAWERALALLRSGGFAVDWRTVCASWCGACTARSRVWVFGTRSVGVSCRRSFFAEVDSWSLPGPRLRGRERVSVAEALPGVGRFVFLHRRSGACVFSSAGVVPTLLTRCGNVPGAYVARAGDAAPFALATRPSVPVLAALSGFPPRFSWLLPCRSAPGRGRAERAACRAIGNAVPPPMMRALASAVLDAGVFVGFGGGEPLVAPPALPRVSLSGLPASPPPLTPLRAGPRGPLPSWALPAERVEGAEFAFLKDDLVVMDRARARIAFKSATGLTVEVTGGPWRCRRVWFASGVRGVQRSWLVGGGFRFSFSRPVPRIFCPRNGRGCSDPRFVPWLVAAIEELVLLGVLEESRGAPHVVLPIDVVVKSGYVTRCRRPGAFASFGTALN